VPPPNEGDPMSKEGQSDIELEEQKRIIASELFTIIN